MGQIKTQLKKLEKDVDAFAKIKDKDDKFAEVMKISFWINIFCVFFYLLNLYKSLTLHHDFVSKSTEKFSLISDMHENMQKAYKDVAQLYNINTKKKNMEEFFSDLNEFRSDYLVQRFSLNIHILTNIIIRTLLKRTNVVKSLKKSSEKRSWRKRKRNAKRKKEKEGKTRLRSVI